MHVWILFYEDGTDDSGICNVYHNEISAQAAKKEQNKIVTLTFTTGLRNGRLSK